MVKTANNFNLLRIDLVNYTKLIYHKFILHKILHCTTLEKPSKYMYWEILFLIKRLGFKPKYFGSVLPFLSIYHSYK